MTDPQRRRVYAWEDRAVAPHDVALVPFVRLQSLVDHVWMQEGLFWPPLGTTNPAVQTGTMLPLHMSLAVIPSAATVAQVGAESQGSRIGAAGQPVNTGGVVSTVQV